MLECKNKGDTETAAKRPTRSADGFLIRLSDAIPHVFVKCAQGDENTGDAAFFCESACAKSAQAVETEALASALDICMQVVRWEGVAGAAGWFVKIIPHVSIAVLLVK